MGCLFDLKLFMENAHPFLSDAPIDPQSGKNVAYGIWYSPYDWFWMIFIFGQSLLSFVELGNWFSPFLLNFARKTPKVHKCPYIFAKTEKHLKSIQGAIPNILVSIPTRL